MKRYQHFSQVERLTLIDGLRAGGLTWQQIADLLDYSGPNAAAEARRRLTAAVERRAVKTMTYEVVKKRVEKQGLRPTARALGYKSPSYLRRWLKQEAASGQQEQAGVQVEDVPDASESAGGG